MRAIQKQGVRIFNHPLITIFKIYSSLLKIHLNSNHLSQRIISLRRRFQMNPVNFTSQVEMVPSNYRMRFSGKSVAFELRSAASLKLPRAQMQKRMCCRSKPPRILLGINLTKNPLRQPALIAPTEVFDNVEAFKCLSMSAWRWE